jgi:POT family proton-dependent oligopeptide transporter
MENSMTREDLFGHPRGLTFLFATEMWERFSYYGMRALLVLYMTKYLFQAGHHESVLGFHILKGTLEWYNGPLDVQPLASLTYGWYTGLVYLAPVLGGLLADRVFGQRRTVIIGAILMAIGHFMMAIDSLFLLALATLILGSGAFKPNISTQVGALYAPGDPRRDRAYSIFYLGTNLGAFLAPLVCGTLGETVGWRYGFGAAGVGMLIGLTIYLYALPSLPPDRLRPVQALGVEGVQLYRGDRRVLFALLLVFIPVALFWAAYEQQGNTMILWADRYTDKSVDLFFLKREIPTTWFQAINPLMIFALTPLIVALWASQAKHGSEPSSAPKMALGCVGLALANLIMVVAAWSVGQSGRTSWHWLVAYSLLTTLGELYLSPVGLSLISKVAPPSALSTMMGLWLATNSLGSFIAGRLGLSWDSMPKLDYFLMIAVIAAAAGAAIWGLSMMFTPTLEQRAENDTCDRFSNSPKLSRNGEHGTDAGSTG